MTLADEMEIAGQYNNARLFLRSVRMAVGEHADVLAELAEVNDCCLLRAAALGGSSGSSQPPDSTIPNAIARHDARVDGLRKKERQLTATIGAGLVFVAGVRVGLGERYADVLERRYIDCEKWRDIAEEMGVDERTVYRYADVACDWADSVGMARALRFGGEA